MTRHWLIVAIAWYGICGHAHSEDGAVGATCWSDPAISSESRQNWCQTVERTFYPGVLMAVAKQAMEKECKRRNALDYGHYGASPGSCADECRRKTFCIYGTTD